MSIDLNQQVKINQSLVITPQLQQAIKILQFSKLELEEFLQDQLIENPLLEDQDESPYTDVTSEEKYEEKIKPVTESLSSQETRVYEESSSLETNKEKETHKGKKNLEKFGKDFNYEDFLTENITLKSHLRDQIFLLNINEVEKKRLLFLIDSLDESGFLKNEIEILSEEKWTSRELQSSIRTLQSLEPPGVGARSLKECLLIQLKIKDKETDLLETLILHHLKDLAKKNYRSICKKLKITEKTLQKNIDLILSLDSQPGKRFHQETALYITPDVHLKETQDGWYLQLEKVRNGNLGINTYYAGLLEKSKNKKDETNYFRQKIKEAKWLIKSLEQRDKTLLKVVRAILEKQEEFFKKGKNFLKPMILKEIADSTSLHESTISRITNNKYIQTKHGLFELRFFFNSRLNSSQGQPISSSVVKVLLAELIKNEDKRKPLSDTKLQEKLKEKDIDIARRTVTKYREQLGFLSSNRRLRYQ